MTDQEPIPQPFDPAPRTPKSPSGCGKPLLVGCAVVAVLMVVALAVLMVTTPDLLAWSLAEMRGLTAEQLPDGLTAGEAERLDDAFAAAIAAIEEGRVRSERLPELQRVLLEVVGKKMTREQVERLTRALEGVAGVEAEPIEEPEGTPAEPAPPGVLAAA